MKFTKLLAAALLSTAMVPAVRVMPAQALLPAGETSATDKAAAGKAGGKGRKRCGDGRADRGGKRQWIHGREERRPDGRADRGGTGDRNHYLQSGSGADKETPAG